MNFSPLRTLVTFVLAIGLLASCEEHPKADLIVYNATVYTVDSAFTQVEAMAIKDGKILETGTLDHIRSTYRAPENIDLEGQFVYPGFIDAHSHFMGYATTLRSVNLVGTKSFEEVVERIKAFQEKYNSTFITGRGWDQNDWEEKNFPNKSELDRLFPKTPVFVQRIDGHAALANQAALEYGKIDTSTTIEGGVITQINGKLSGILIDNAMSLIKPPAMEVALTTEALAEAQQNLFEVGLTTVTDAGLERYQIELLDSLDKAGLLNIRVYAMVSDRDELVDYYLKKGKIKTDHLNVSSVKFYMDGALGSRGALMLEPYADDSVNTGLQLYSTEHYYSSAKKLKEKGWQMCIHAIGDSANRLSLNVYEEILDGATDRRWRIEHCQIVTPSDLSRFGSIGVLPSIQPTHATSDMYWAEERLGSERIKLAYSYKDLLASAGILPLGTDFPIEGIDPLQTFYSAVFRQDSIGFPEGGFIPNQRLSREQTLQGITTWAAYAGFEELEKGSLEAGKMADFVVLNQDLLKVSQEDFHKTKVIMTFLGGDLVYTKNKVE